MIDRLTWRIGFIAAAVLAALLFVGFATQTIRIEGLRIWPLHIVGFKERVAVLRLDLDAIKAGQEIADAKWKQQIAEREAASRAAIQGARNDERQKAMRDAAAAFADRNRVRSQAGSAPQGGANPSGSAEQGDDGPGTDAGLVAVPRQDFDLLVNNTIRLDTVRRQACAMIDKGVAVPESGAKCE